MKHVVQINLVVGMWLIVVPFVFGYSSLYQAAAWNEMIVGAMLVTSAWWILVETRPQIPCTGLEMVCGAWLIAAPWAMGYRFEARTIDVIAGALVLIVSVVEILRVTRRAAETV